MKIVRFLDQEIAEDLTMDIDDVRYALDTLQKDGLLYWHRLSGLVIVTEHWRHNRIINPSISKHIEKVVMELPDKCGVESFSKIAEIFGTMVSAAHFGDPSFVKNKESISKVEAYYLRIVMAATQRIEAIMTHVSDTHADTYVPLKEVGRREERVGKGKKEKDKSPLRGPLKGAQGSGAQGSLVCECENEVKFTEEEEREQRLILSAVRYFTEKYQQHRGARHRPINGESNLDLMRRVLEVLDGYSFAEDGDENTRRVIDAYFRRDYTDCDYSFWHFTTERVWGYVGVELGILDSVSYFDVDGQARDIIEY
jgi:hypothetical protein